MLDKNKVIVFFLITVISWLLVTPVIANEVIRVRGIRIDNRDLTLLWGEEQVLQVSLIPRDATDQRVWWSNSNERVLGLRYSGKRAYITARAPGEAVITAVSADGRFTVRSYITVIKLVTSIGIESDSLVLAPGETVQLKAWVEPRDASEQAIIWESSDNGVASVDAEGNVKAIREGETRIIARSLENRNINSFATVRVTAAAAVTPPVVIGEQDQSRLEPPLINERAPDGENGFISYLLYILIAAPVVALAAFVYLRLRRPATKFPSRSLSVPVVGASGRLPVLAGISGLYAGSKFALNTGPLTIGRDQNIARVVYPQEYDQISRRHLTIHFDPASESFLFEDTSSNGTFLSNGSRLQPHQVLQSGETITLANTEETFVVKLE